MKYKRLAFAAKISPGFSPVDTFMTPLQLITLFENMFFFQITRSFYEIFKISFLETLDKMTDFILSNKNKNDFFGLKVGSSLNFNTEVFQITLCKTQLKFERTNS